MSDPAWLNPDVSREIDAPVKGRLGDRSGTALRAVIEQFEVATCERYRKRDIDGVPGDETCCNFFVREVLSALGVVMPRTKANDFFDYFSQHTPWEQLRSPWVARALADAGYPVVVVWVNPNGAHGHVALVVPSRNELDKQTTFIAQAGASNFAYARLEQGFGTRPVAFFTHP